MNKFVKVIKSKKQFCFVLFVFYTCNGLIVEMFSM